ncbi:nicotinate-nucleotide adenylyltransferase [Peribacillus sp. SCS-26]|uniref:nicotinate-nucleotide adenylyltransferase n=1 Tax=Paraperibacillus marinus TaxID=3115295 RepID=UPI003906A0C1
MKKVGILGGTFDPPHIGHLIVANEVREALELDEVRLMPNSVPPHKKKNGQAAADDRLEMVRLAVKTNPGLSAEGIELNREGLSYTYDTIAELKELEPDSAFYFIIGADMIEYLPKWHKIDELVKLVQFAGVRRPNHSIETPYPVKMVEMPQIELSSSIIRERIKEGRPIRYLVTEEVRSYIEVNGLYGS